jgi:hypothetical protein
VGSLGVQNGDDWIAAEATIVSVKRRLFAWSHSDQDYPLPEYVVTFSYIVGSRLVRGKYVTTSPEKEGHKFSIFYDPEHPSRNTGLDEPIVPWVRWTAGAIGIGLAVIAIWLWGDQEWFNN